MAETPGLNLFRQAGMVGIRDDFTWEQIERAKGIYDWSRPDKVMQMVTGAGLRLWAVLTPKNPLYATPPFSGTDLTAFKKFARAAVSRYAGKGVVWEAANEPDLEQFWPLPDPVAYAKFVQALAATVRDVSKDEWLVAGGTGTTGANWNDPEPSPFLLRAIEEGLPVDCLVPHGYRNSSPDTIILAMLKLERSARLRGYSGSFGIGEWGYTKDQFDPPSEDARAKAYNLLTALCLERGWPVAVFNAQYEPFGVLKADGSPLPCLSAIQQAIVNDAVSS